MAMSRMLFTGKGALCKRGISPEFQKQENCFEQNQDIHSKPQISDIIQIVLKFFRPRNAMPPVDLGQARYPPRTLCLSFCNLENRGRYCAGNGRGPTMDICPISTFQS